MAQKNTAELASRRGEVGWDFAVAEERQGRAEEGVLAQHDGDRSLRERGVARQHRKERLLLEREVRGDVTIEKRVEAR